MVTGKIKKSAKIDFFNGTVLLFPDSQNYRGMNPYRLRIFRADIFKK